MVPLRIQTVAVDYDGTIAREGVVPAETVTALGALRQSGRRLILVTGRQLEDLRRVAPDLTLFDLVVAENGAVLFDPHRQEVSVLGEPPPPELLSTLRRHAVPFDVGHVVVATGVPHDVAVQAAIRDLGLEWQIIYNKGSAMALPAGITKASGLRAALDRLGLSPHSTAGIGDAENDHSFLSLCEVAAAVGNALPALKARAGLVMRRANGRGVVEFIERYVLNDFAAAPQVFRRYSVELGTTRSGTPVRVPVYGANLLIVGSSGSGKSTLTGVFVEQLIEQGYQVCLIDPEGEHAALAPLLMVTVEADQPAVEEIEIALERAEAGVVVNLVALSLADKARFAAEVLSRIAAQRAAAGRPRWVVIDEAHHLLPAEGAPAVSLLPEEVDGFCLVTLRPTLLPPAVLQRVTHVCVTGDDAPAQVEAFARTRATALPAADSRAAWSLLEGEALIGRIDDGRLTRLQRFRVAPRRTEHRRHVRKYARGDLGESSFYFRGPSGRLNLRAYNVTAFVEMARGVDDETWQYHLTRGDISTWFRDKVKDPDLARQIAQVEARAAALGPRRSREAVVHLIESRYTIGG